MAGRKLPSAGLGADEDVGADQRDHGQVLRHQRLHAVVEALARGPVERHQLPVHEVVDFLLPWRERRRAGQRPQVGRAAGEPHVHLAVRVHVAAGQGHDGRVVIVASSTRGRAGRGSPAAPPGPRCPARAGRPGRSVAICTRWALAALVTIVNPTGAPAGVVQAAALPGEAGLAQQRAGSRQRALRARQGAVHPELVPRRDVGAEGGGPALVDEAHHPLPVQSGGDGLPEGALAEPGLLARDARAASPGRGRSG